MNKIYKVIWSKAKNCYVVVSEIAKRNGKCSSSLNEKILAAFLVAGLVTVLPMRVEAGVVISTATGNTSTSTPASGNMAFAIGYDVTDAHGYRSLAWGQKTYTSGTNATAFGESTNAGGRNSLAFGKSTNAGGENSLAFGF